MLPRSVDQATEPFRAVGSGRDGWQTGRRWRRPWRAAPPPGQVGGGRSWPRAWRCHAGEGGSRRAGPRTGATPHVHVGPPWPLLVFFAVVALAAAALTVSRRRRATPPPPRPDADPDAGPLAAALAAGARALHEDPDPRTAI